MFWVPRMIVINFTGGIGWKLDIQTENKGGLKRLSIGLLGVQVIFFNLTYATLVIWRNGCRECTKQLMQSHFRRVDGELEMSKSHSLSENP